MGIIYNKRFTKLRLQLELLASHTSYSADNFVFKYVYDNVELPTRNFGNIRLYEVQYSIDRYFIIEYYVGNVRLLETYDLSTANGGLHDCSGILKEVIDLISDVIDCVTVSFTDNTKAKAFLDKYLARGYQEDFKKCGFSVELVDNFCLIVSINFYSYDNDINQEVFSELEVTKRTFNSGYDDSGSIYFFVYA